MKNDFTNFLMAVCAVGLSIGAIVAACRMRVDLAPNWLVGAYQFFLLAGGVFLLFGIGSIVFWLYGSALDRLAKLEESHSDLLRLLDKKTRPWIVATIYVAGMYLVFADKVFGDDVGTTIAATLILTGWFHVANHFIESDNPRTSRWIGLPLWLLGVAFLPISAIAYHGNLADSWNVITSVPWYTLVLVCLGIVYIVWIPFALDQHVSEEVTDGRDEHSKGTAEPVSE